MKIVVSSRGMGKTTLCILESAASGAHIVCANHAEAYRIAEQAKEMGKEIPFPLTYDEFIRGEYSGKGVRGLLIDNADRLLQYMAKVPIQTVILGTD